MWLHFPHNILPGVKGVHSSPPPHNSMRGALPHRVQRLLPFSVWDEAAKQLWPEIRCGEFSSDCATLHAIVISTNIQHLYGTFHVQSTLQTLTN